MIRLIPMEIELASSGDSFMQQLIIKRTWAPSRTRCTPSDEGPKLDAYFFTLLSLFTLIFIKLDLNAVQLVCFTVLCALTALIWGTAVNRALSRVAGK